MRTTGIIVLIALLLSPAISGCGGKPATGPRATRAKLVPSQIGPDGYSGTVANDVREVRVVAHRYAFEPDRIVVRKGEQVRILVTSTDVTHGFAIDILKINAKVEPGKVAMVEFALGRWGEFPFYCSVNCGPGSKDMRGTLVVRP